MFPQKLERIIRPLASKIIESKVKDSKSIYYEVDDVRMRLSDHPAHSMDYDLAIYYLNTHYVVISVHNKRMESGTYKTKEEVIEYIKLFVKLKRLFLG